MRLIFMGTPEFAVPSLKGLLEAGHDIPVVYSQPPRPAGRGHAERSSPVHRFASSKGIEVRTPYAFKRPSEFDYFRDIKADAAVVVAYGLILPRALLKGTKRGCFNVHASLLPRWRGAAPIQRAIMAGDAETGVTIMQMEEGLDAGPRCMMERVPIKPETTAGVLHNVLAELGAQMIVKAMSRTPLLCAPQPTEGVTYARKIEKAETKIDFARDAVSVRNHIHGLSPFPGAWFMLDNTRIKVLQCEAVDGSGEPGTIIDDRLAIACGSGAIRLINVQREGRGVMDAQEFLRGFAVTKGIKVA
jgi:methionyl-tRNA formyltransferase